MPKSIAATTIAGSSSAAGHCSAQASAASPTPSPPIIAWPSPPMLNRPAWNATATASPVKTKVVA